MDRLRPRMSTSQPASNKNILTAAEEIRRRQDRIWEHRFVWLLLLLVLGLWGYFYAIGRVDQKLAHEVAKRLRKEFPAHVITVDRAHLQAGQSITIEGIRIAKSTDQGLRDVLRVAKLVCDGPIEMIGLVQGQVPVQSVVAEGVEVCLWPLTDGRFSIQELSSTKPISPTLPKIEVRSGMVRVSGPIGKAEQEIICHDLRVYIDHVRSSTVTAGTPRLVQCTASVASSYFTTAQVQAFVTEDKSAWRLSGAVAKIDYTQRLIQQLPPQIQEYLKPAMGFSGQLNVNFEAQSEQGRATFKANADIADGRLMHPKVPYPLESISGRIYCDNSIIQMRNIRASSGDASITMACDIHGLSINAPMTANADIKNLALDARLHQALPPSLQDIWLRLGVSGTVDAKTNLSFNGTTWKPEMFIQAKNGGVHADYFPYPITNLNGSFYYNGNEIIAKDLRAVAGDQAISGQLTLTKASPRWLMDLIIAADGPVVIDEALLRALTPRDQAPSGLQAFVRSLHPTGTVHLKRAHFIRSKEQPDWVSRAIELTFSECSVRYDNFRYPISNIQGQATVDNDRIILKELSGRNDGAHIRGGGVCQCRNSSLDTLDLDFEALDIALDEELQQALPRSVRGFWDQIQPSGVMDRVAVKMHQGHQHDPLDLQVELIEERNAEAGAGNSVSIRPASIPYAVNDIECKILYRPGRLDIHRLSGLHEASRLQAQGQCQLNLDGTWNGMLTWLPLTRFMVDQQFLSCMPSSLRDPLTKMDFRGPVSITGSTQIESPTRATDSVVRMWDLELQIEEGRLSDGNLASGIRGAISIAGENTPDGPQAFGLLDIDAVSIRNIAVTGMKGPFAFNHRELFFGRDAAQWKQSRNLRSPGSLVAMQRGDSNVVPAAYGRVLANLASRRRGQSNNDIPNALDSKNPSSHRASPDAPLMDTSDNDIRARMLSGTMFFSGVEPLGMGARSRYRLRLVDSDFHGFLVDQGETHTQASGRLFVQADLQGSVNNIAALEGKGKAWLRQASLYELPAIIGLFKSLSLRPDQGAFDSADVDFEIDGDRIPVTNLQLDGDLVSMRGSGWINMRRELHFDLDANVSRRAIVGAVFRPIANQTNTRLFRLEVDGTTSDIKTRRPKALMNTLEHVLPEGG